MSSLPKPPKAAKKPHDLTMFGVARNDPYFWMRERDDPEVRDYLERENAYLDAVMAPHAALRKTLYEEMVARLKPDDASVPYQRGDYFYYRRYEPGKEYPFYCRRKGSPEGPEQVLLDTPSMAKGKDFFELGSMAVSANQDLLAYTVDTVGRRIYEVRFKNIETGEDYPDVLTHVCPSMAWAADNRTIFYVRTDAETLRSCRLYRHRLGEDPAKDELIFEETDETYHLDVFPSASRDFVIIQSFSTLSTECRILDAKHPEGRFEMVQARENNHRYFLDHFGEDVYILSNKDAINYRLAKTKPGRWSASHWETVIEHRPEVLLEDFHEFKHFLVVLEREKGLQRIRVMPRDGRPEHRIAFDQEAYSLGLDRNCIYDTGVLRFNFESLATPHSVYDYDMETRERKLLKRDEVLGDFDAENYVTLRLEVPARDGAMVPVSLVHHKSVKLDGTQPLLLLGYGSYGIKLDPSFRASRLSLLNRGFVFAMAHIRGGADLGRQWYEDGKLHRKKNTFNDFMDCGQYLVDEQFADPARLFAIGGSAGGMLMGVVANERPDLFKGIIANVPFVDCVTTMCDTSIPLTTGEFDEWGNPANEADFHYILGYSPYDNVSRQDYPNLLVIAGFHDSQVQYWEPAKWVAKLRDLKTDSRLLLLFTQMEAGHGGASGRFRRFEEEAMQHSFLLVLAGLADKG